MGELLRTGGQYHDLILQALGRHLLICIIALALGMMVAVPTGIFLSFHRRATSGVLVIFSVINTIPSIVLLGIAMILFGLGMAPSVAVLFLYSLLPVLRATYTGIKDINPKYVKAAAGMGMSRWQTLWSVTLPLAMPSILTGVRLSAVYIISWATLAAFIGGGGLGDVIWMGLQSYNFRLVFWGAGLATLLAFATSWLLNRMVQRSRRHVNEETPR